MKFVFLLAVSLAVVAAVEKYDTKNDDFDVAALVADVEKLRQFTGCFLEKNPCNDISTAFKKDLGEAIQEACAKCSAAQKNQMKLYLNGIQEKTPQDYEEFKKKYDPENKYMVALNNALENA
ncbi:unnamed protein product [Diatraea saccharalis]|uniref:Chemosensory protein n=1 Tax=Diatraea saccharalis TaxID=40085 RepID=A0A9N9RFC2_9NEOP|nr:unnamed protein product [Diatraea saccharalis]